MSEPTRPPRFAEDDVQDAATIDDLVEAAGIDVEPAPDDIAARTRLAIARAEAAARAKQEGAELAPAESVRAPAAVVRADEQPTAEPSTDVAAADEAPVAESSAGQSGGPTGSGSPDERSGEDDGVVLTGGGFALLGLHPDLLGELDALGYEEPTPIQSEAIGPLLESRDLLGQAATGTGKTAAFALPLLHRLAEEPKDGVRGAHPLALVLVPTRELAMQVSQAVHRYGRRIGAQVVPVYGGQPIWRQLKALERGVDVVVGTPGRIKDHLGRGSLDLSHLEVIVLDEADEMLDMGFQEDIEEILAAGPEYRQTMLFSATMPKHIASLAKRHLHEPVRITIERNTPAGESPLIEQRAYVVGRQHKAAALGRILDVENPTAAIVFCGTRVEVDELTQVMNGRGYRAEALHGGMTQQQRDKVMDRLRRETAELLVATDVAARGLDIDHLTHVVNFDVPSAPESYVHRIGRVGRAGREGVAITLVEPRQHRLLQAIERHTGTKLPVAQVPTAADLRKRRDDQVRDELAERLRTAGAGELDRHRHVLESLAEDHDVIEIALAAIAVAQEAIGPDVVEDDDLPEARLQQGGGDRGGDRGGRGPGKGGARGPKGPPEAGMARLWISVGFQGKVRPKDVVGAIANETSVKGKEIGNIDITPKFTLVDVPAAKAQEVIDALQNTTLQGRRPKVRRDRA